jgi:GDP-4-dehydro-6-deoxy-D-mannose reductase
MITGAAGFVGGHLTEHLVAAGDEVVGIDRTEGPDLLDADGIARTIADVAPDVVYHLGGWSDVGGSWNDPVTVLRVNAEGTLNVLEGSRPVGCRVLVVSSAEVYGRVEPGELPLTESTPVRPVSPYAASKAAAELLATQAWLGYGLPTIAARSFNNIGPGQSERFVAPALAARIARNELAGEAVVAVGNVTPRRDFTDVRDVVRAYRLLATDGDPGGTYQVCSGADSSIRELAEALVGRAETPMHLEADPDLQRPVDVPVLRGDPTRLQQATGWKPEISIEQSLDDLLTEWRREVRS